MSPKAVKFALFAVVATVLTVLDQITKWWVRENIEYAREEISVIDGFFSLVHAQNRGAAFGFMDSSEYRMVVFAVFTIVAVGVLLQMLWQLPDDDRFQTIAVGTVMSGAVGNAIDRVMYQSVTDFLRIYTEHPSLQPTLIDWFGTYEWPSFNVADVAIVVGLIMFFFHYLFLEKDDEDLEPSPPKAVLPDEDASEAPTEVAAG